jgi:phosphoserine phosphatase
MIPRVPVAALLLSALFACAPSSQPSVDVDPLPSWADRAPKQRILDFIDRVTDESGPDFVQPPQRIATFDNDGTLLVEKPDYMQFELIFDEIERMAPNHPEWKSVQPFKAALERDFETIDKMGANGGITLLFTTYAGMTQREFSRIAERFIATDKHSRYQRPYTDLVYQPMLELLALLRANDFEVFLVSAGTVELMRTYSLDVYGIPRHHVIGTTFQQKYEPSPLPPQVRRLPKITTYNNRSAKPENIQLHIGQRPILAVGNSDGDIQMLQFAENDIHPYLQLLVHHDDADREYDYDEGTEDALQQAVEHNWTVVSLKQDFLRLFPFDD